MANDMKQYETLITDSLFEEAYMLLEQNVSKIDDVITKNKHIRDFFSAIFADDFFNGIIDRNNLFPVAMATVDSLRHREFLKPVVPKFGNFVDSIKSAVMFAFLIQANEFDNAKFLLPYFKSNVEGFKNTISEIVDNNNIPALRFVCENMENIHFNEGSLLRIASKMQPEAIRMLVEDFKFDINEQAKDTGYNLVHILTYEKNVKNFKFVVENYGGLINWGATTAKKGRTGGITFFDMVDQLGMQGEFYPALLDDMSLKGNYIGRITDSLFSNPEVISHLAETDIYSKLFAHPNFNPNVMNLGQGYFLYGILSQLGKVANTNRDGKDTTMPSGEDAAKPYFQILDSYIHSYADDDVPEATNYHIVGAAVHVASKSQSKIVADAAGLIMRRYGKYINKPNPFGTLPILQVEKDSPIFRMLINNGAIPPPPEPGFWGSMFSVLGGRKAQQEVEIPQQQEVKSSIKNSGNYVALRNQMRDDFRVMRSYISNELCDPTIKFKCENMFLKSERLAMMMEKHNVTQAYEDLHFLGENFSNYLKESLSSYISVCQATVDLAADDKKVARLHAAKNQCLEHVDLLAEQLNLISQNIFNEVEGNASRNLNVRGRFLQNRFPNAKDLGMDAIMENNKNSVQAASREEANDLPLPARMRQTLEKSEEIEKELGDTQPPAEPEQPASRQSAVRIRL